MPPRRTRNSDRPRASDRTMVATESNRLPSFKSRRTLSLLENEPRERKSHPEKNLSSDREPSANSGLDIETKNLSATSRGRTFFVDIPFYRTTYLRVRYGGGNFCLRRSLQAEPLLRQRYSKTPSETRIPDSDFPKSGIRTGEHPIVAHLGRSRAWSRIVYSSGLSSCDVRGTA